MGRRRPIGCASSCARRGRCRGASWAATGCRRAASTCAVTGTAASACPAALGAAAARRPARDRGGRHGRLLAPPRRRALLALACVGLAYATVIQSFSWNQTSHYALIRSLAHGTARIDRYANQTNDKARFRGHWYSSRAPGLAILSVPAYGALTAAQVPALARHMQAQRNADEMVWALGLWGSVLRALVLLLLVRKVADTLEPGYGTAAAVTLGLGSLILPLGLLLFIPRASKKSWSTMFAPVHTIASTMLLRIMSTNTSSSAPRENSDPARVRITPHSLVAEHPAVDVGRSVQVTGRVRHVLHASTTGTTGSS